MFAGRYENASDKRVCVSASARIRANCGLGFTADRGGEKIRLPDSRSGKDRDSKKKQEKNRPGKSPGNQYPENIPRKKYLEKYPGQKGQETGCPGRELLPGKSVPSIPLLQMRLFRGV